jgi:magnesium-transporting ATPase (P-type)
VAGIECGAIEASHSGFVVDRNQTYRNEFSIIQSFHSAVSRHVTPCHFTVRRFPNSPVPAQSKSTIVTNLVTVIFFFFLLLLLLLLLTFLPALALLLPFYFKSANPQSTDQFSPWAGASIHAKI